jgi:hypothetical protein
MAIAYVLFFVVGLVFGYAAPGRARLLPLLFPLALALGAVVRDGADGETVLKLLLSLVLSGLGIAAGAFLDERSRGHEARV